MRDAAAALAGPAVTMALPVAETPPAAGADAALVQAVESWRLRLAAAGIACAGVALYAPDARHRIDFPPSLDALDARWRALRATVDTETPVAISRPDAPGAELLLATALQAPDGAMATIGVALGVPHGDRVVQQVLLTLGWLQLAMAAPRLARAQRAARLLDLLGHVASQRQARGAAQEWINRSARWARDEAPDAVFALTLFTVRGGRPKPWVTADAAWTETAAPGVQAATEAAAQALMEGREVPGERVWALLQFATDGEHAGEAVAVLVAVADAPPAGGWPEPALSALRASLAMAEPLLRQWRVADQPLWRHAIDSAAFGWRRFSRPGHLAWKTGAAGAALAAALLFALPVPDRITAQTAIEGRQRQIITVPFDGFIGEVLVRPGERVQPGQTLARLDDRDLKLEQARHRSEREQAAGKLRQAMTDHEAPAMALAIAEQSQADAQLALVEAKLARTTLVSPQGGLVVAGDWVQQIGGPVETGKEMFEIASGAGWRVVLHVPDRDIARVHVGQHGTLRLTGRPDVGYEFIVSTVTATASVQDGVNGFRVEADWVGDVPALSPGMQGVGKVEVGTTIPAILWTRSSLDWLRLKAWAWWW